MGRHHGRLSDAEDGLRRGFPRSVKTRVAVARDDERARRVLALLDERAYRCNHRVGLRLRFDAGRSFLQGYALDCGAAGDPKRLQGAVDAGGDSFGRIGVDDENVQLRQDSRRGARYPAVGHRPSALPVVLLLWDCVDISALWRRLVAG